MKKLFLVLLGAVLATTAVVYAAPLIQYFNSISPFTDNTYDNGDALHAWKNIYAHNYRFATTTTGCLNGNTTSAGITTAYFTGTPCGSGSGSNSFAFPFDVHVGYNSTTTVIGFQGLFSTASSTFSSALRLTSLNQGVLYVGSGGLVQTAASSTLLSGFSPSSNITSDATGQLIATGTQLTFGNFLATTTATSTIPIGALQIGQTARDSALNIVAGRIYPASVSTGGMVHIENGTTNSGTALEVTSAFGASATGRVVVINQTNSAFDQDVIVASSSAANTTLLNLKGAPTGKGILKIEHTGNPTDANANGSSISIDNANCGNCQSIFITSTISTTSGNFFTGRNFGGGGGQDMFAMKYDGKFGISTATPYAMLSVKSANPATTTAAIIGYSAQTADLLHVFTGSNLMAMRIAAGGFATTTLSGLTINGQATSTSNVGFNLTGGCYAVNNSCITGTGGSGSGTVNSGPAGYLAYYNTTGTAVSPTSTAPLYVDGIIATSSTIQSRIFNSLLVGDSNSGASIVGSTGIMRATGGFYNFTTNNDTVIANDVLRDIFFKILQNGATLSTAMTIHRTGRVGIGTTTPQAAQLDISSSTAPQLALGNASTNIFTFRTDGSNLSIGTSSPTTFATNTPSQISIAATGFGTTTLSGLVINGQATSTSNVGFNITNGCYAVNGVCASGTGGGGSGSVTSVALALPTFFNISGSPVTTTGTLTGSITQPANSILTTDAAGTNIMATGSQLTIGSLLATSTLGSATSTFVGASRFGIGASAKDNLIQVDCNNRIWPASISTGGCMNVDLGTANTGGGFVVHRNTAGSEASRMAVFYDDNTATIQDTMLIQSDGTGNTPLNVKSSATGKGAIKAEHLGVGTGFASASLFSGDTLSCGDCQHINLSATTATTTGDFINAKNFDTRVFFSLKYDGRLGVGTTSPYAQLSVLGMDIATTTFAVQPKNGQLADTMQVWNTSQTNLALMVDNAGNVGVSTTSPSTIDGSKIKFSVGGTVYVNGTTTLSADNVHVGQVSCNNPLSALFTKGLEVCGNDNTTKGIELGVANNNAGSSAYSTFFLNNNLADNTVTHYGALFLNSSNYTDSSFGTALAVKNQLGIQNSDGMISLISSTSTNALNDSGINFITGGSSTSNERGRVTLEGYWGFGTTTPKGAVISVASTTQPQLKLSSGTTDNSWNLRGVGNSFYIATGSPTTFATSSTAALSIDTNGKVRANCFTTDGSTCIAGGGTVTSVGFSGTGMNIANSPVTTSGTLTATFASGFSDRKLPSYVVAATGGDFTTIQGALTQCGTDGGGNIYLTDATYAQAGTGLTFRGSNCHLIGRGSGTTTITFTGATTLFKTNSAVGLFTNVSIDGITITADGNTSGVAIDFSDMTHSNYRDINLDNVGTCLKASDTQNITFYNTIKDISCTTVTSKGINASSTNPVNSNLFENVFIGGSANSTALEMNNGNGNTFIQFRSEPASVTGTVGIHIFDSTLASNDGVFQNTWNDSYIEANGTGIKIDNAVGAGGGVQRNLFNGGMVEANTNDFVFGTAAASKNSFLNITDSNFTNPVQSIRSPFGINTLTQRSIFNINTPSFGSPALQIYNNNGFAENATNYVELGLINATDSSNLLSLQNNGTGNTIIASSTNILFVLDGKGKHGVGTTTLNTVPGRLVVASSTTAQLTLQGATGQNPWNFRSIGGALYIGTSSPTTQATTTLAQFGVGSDGVLIAGDYANCNGATNALGVTSGRILCDSGVSDSRLKKDVNPLEEGLGIISQLKPVTFLWNDLTNHNTSNPGTQYGFIAQDVQPLVPSAVGESPDGYLTLDKTALIAPMVRAIQEQQAEIEALGGKAEKAMTDNWQWECIGALVVWNLYLTLRRRK